MYRGYIKLWRKQKDWYGMGSMARIALWVTLLIEANHKKTRKIFKGKIVDILPGQMLTGRKYLSSLSGVSESHVERLLKEFKNEQQIIQQPSTQNRLITICNWAMYQEDGNNKGYNKGYNQLDNRRTTEGKKKDTPKNDKNEKNDKKEKYIEFVYLSSAEYKRLKEHLGQERLTYYISQLNNYIGSKGKRYKSHYHTILAWADKEMSGRQKQGGMKDVIESANSETTT